jgi:hypothetical protein
MRMETRGKYFKYKASYWGWDHPSQDDPKPIYSNDLSSLRKQVKDKSKALYNANKELAPRYSIEDDIGTREAGYYNPYTNRFKIIDYAKDRRKDDE